ncbi:hypothetical protein ACFOWZ_16130 [Lentzea rhizosphaerae]|uniref:Uncharacterized protein n=1 Tax=Lentzea rhizosphaerae TaxID=2041025 RepID=A0ABV8BRJ6_9PSEU
MAVIPEDLVQWGGTDSGDSQLWLPAGERDDWPTTIVLGLLTGAVSASPFPDDFPSGRPQFSTNSYA